MAVEKSPVQWALTPLKRYAEFSGRSSRAEFWWFTLFIFVIFIVMWFLLVGSMTGFIAAGAEPNESALQAMGGGMLIFGLFWLAILIPSIAVQVRRVHDGNRSGWWVGGYYLLYLVYIAMSFTTMMSAVADSTAAAEPNMGMFGMTMVLGLGLFVYFIVLLVFWILPGTPGDNRYGPDPYGADVEKVFA